MRRSLTVLAPIAAGALVLALAAAYPSSAVHGDFATGPKPPHTASAPAAGKDYRVRWNRHATSVVLGVRDGAACRPRVLGVTSTGPARLEVRVDRPSGAACTASPRWWSLPLAPPVIRARSQGVHVLVDGASLSTGRPPA